MLVSLDGLHDELYQVTFSINDMYLFPDSAAWQWTALYPVHTAHGAASANGKEPHLQYVLRCLQLPASWFANKKEDGFSHTGNVSPYIYLEQYTNPLT